MADVPLARRSASEQIFDELRRSILAGEIGSGERLPTERELAARYGVSVNTVRESVRALSVMGLVQVRHGMGAYVSASTPGLVGRSLTMAMQFEHTGLVDVVRLAGVLHRHAATRAVEVATDDDVAAFEGAIVELERRLADAAEADELAAAVEAFLASFVACAHDPLLAAVSGPLDRVVVTIVADAYAAAPGALRDSVLRLGPVRVAMLEGLRARDRQRLELATDEYHRAAAEVVVAHPDLASLRLSEPRWSAMLASLVDPRG